MKYPCIFIGNIPRGAKQKDIENLLKRFGRIITIRLQEKEKGPSYVVARYATHTSQEKACDADLKLYYENTALHIEEKRAKFDYFPWLELSKQIDFDELAEDYAYRNVVMEDHLVEFILSLATYHRMESEPYQDLVDRLTSLCHIKPKDLHDLCPPHLSGMIFNKSGKDKNGRNTLQDFKCILLAAENITLRRDDTVEYKIPMISREQAEYMLRLNLVKGLFLYFFAKFAHGPKFIMRQRFYGGSEPLKTTLEVVTGHSHINVALKAYFNLMNPYFSMDYKKDELKLKNDLYRPKPRARSTKASNAVISNQLSKDAVYNELNAPKPSERSSKKLYSEILCKNSEEPYMVSNVQSPEVYIEDQHAIYQYAEPMEPLDINGNIDEFATDDEDEEYPVVISVVNQVLEEKKCANCSIKLEVHNAHDLYDCVDELLKNLAKKDARIRELEIQNVGLKSKLEIFQGDLV